jgi:hypothetical protein
MKDGDQDKKPSHDYELDHSDSKIKRLARQAQLVDPMRRGFFQDAGCDQQDGRSRYGQCWW